MNNIIIIFIRVIIIFIHIYESNNINQIQQTIRDKKVNK